VTATDVQTHPEYLAFLRAICAAPEDDTARLVLADWLEEHGERERAEFIRVQCAIIPMLARVPCICRELVCPACKSDHEMMAAVAREEGLFRESKAWLATEWEHVYLPHRKWTAARTYPTPCVFLDRGFVSQVTCTAADWLAHADALHWHPSQGRPIPPTAQPITHVTLTTIPAVGDGDRRKFDIAGQRVEMPPDPWPYEPGEHRYAGRTGRWYAGMLSLRWPGVAFKVQSAWDGP